tara:strand:- start:855 stop:2267 length:1413 start_codon:yes stop_codon:yes gene_type:complete
MKKIYKLKSMKLFLYALLIFSFLSCESKIDDIAPENSITDTVIFSNKDQALSVVIGMYGEAQKDDILNGTPQLMTEWQSDNMEFVGSFPTFQELYEYTTLATNTSIDPIYEQAYDLIRQCNLVIENIPLVTDPAFTDAEKSDAVGQAKFLRALAHLQLNNLFGNNTSENNLSVPLVTSVLSVTDPFQERNTIAAIYNQIEVDLKEAIESITNSDRTFATSIAAKALLARVKLYRGDYPSARDLANEVINSGLNSGFSTLATDYAFYNTLSTEFIFTLVNTTNDGQDSGQGWSGLTNPVPEGRGDAPFSQNLLDTFAEEPGDLRFSSLSQTGTDAGGLSKSFTTKFPDAITNSANAPVLRITEMYLTRAEGNFREGTNIGDTALNDINKLRDRADLGALTTLTIEEILNERRKELCFEGFRRMDLIRTGQNLRRAGMPNEADSAPGNSLVTFPIPQAARDINPALTQNNGY